MPSRKPRGVGAVALLCLLASSGVAFAQAAEEPPFDPAIDVQTFEYAIGPKTFFTVSDADVAAPKQLAIDALVTYLTRPFKIYDVDNDDPDMITGERTVVVDSLASAQITAAYGVNERLQVGANLPIIFRLAGDGLDPSSGRGTMDGLNVTGLGDLVVEGKYRLHRKNGVAAAVVGQVTLPSSFGSDGSEFIGDDLPSLRAKGLLQYASGRISVGANGGILLRKPREIYDSTIGPQLLWGVGAALKVTEKLAVIGEGYGRAGFDFSMDASPLEALGGLRLHATSSVLVVLGGGAGLVKGIGAPESRFFLSVGYSPDVRDSDGDGVANSRDKCSTVPEDRDGHEDADGCPDDDDDGDRRMDGEDKCPAAAEDIDGFEDDDGCPELDNDKDGIDDLKDKCINEAEDGKEPNATDGCPANRRDSDSDGVNDSLDACPTAEEDMDGFEDGDGCPEADNDNDGVPDTADKCPLCTEDKDGFEDGDGCPDLDNDKDGVADAADKCASQPETLNGVTDGDGCPDGPAAFVKLDGDRLVIDKVPAFARGRLTAQGTQVVDAIAVLLVANDDISKVLIALAQPKADVAQQLADAVKARLVARGVAAERVDVIGAAGAARIGGVVQARREASEAPAPVCPAASVAKPRPEASAPPAPSK